MGTPAVITTTFSGVNIYCHYDGQPENVVKTFKNLTKKWNLHEFEKRTPKEDPEYFMNQLINCFQKAYMSDSGTNMGIFSGDYDQLGAIYVYEIDEDCDVRLNDNIIYNIETGESYEF